MNPQWMCRTGGEQGWEQGTEANNILYASEGEALIKGTEE